MVKKAVRKVVRKLIGESDISSDRAFNELNKGIAGGVSKMGDFSDDDVFIVGFPKSGNTLMQHIICHLFYGTNENTGRSLVNVICPDIYANKYYLRFGRTCFFKSHELPQDHHRKVIYLVRDGRDALVSYSVMMNKMGKSVNMEKLFTGEELIMDSEWHLHVNAWIDHGKKIELLILKFEDIVDDKRNVIRQICEFLNISRTEDEIQQVINNTSLEKFRLLEKRLDWINMKKQNDFKNDTSFTNKGESRQYVHNVRLELLRIFNEKSKETLKIFNYKIE